MLHVPAATLAAIAADCLARRPDEACGLLIGRTTDDGPRVAGAVPVANVWPIEAERPRRYAVDPLTQANAERQAAADGFDLVGFYHSHPTSRPVPSEFDREAAWPTYHYLIVGLSDMIRPEYRVWALDEGGAFVEHPVRSITD